MVSMSDPKVQLDPMIIRMARAIALSQGRSDWQEYVQAARASLSALRDPSDEMLEAATHGLPDWGDLTEEWHAMIDHVLGEETTTINDNAAIVTVPSKVAS
jgi:hypothetical protein